MADLDLKAVYRELCSIVQETIATGDPGDSVLRRVKELRELIPVDHLDDMLVSLSRYARGVRIIREVIEASQKGETYVDEGLREMLQERKAAEGISGVILFNPSPKSRELPVSIDRSLYVDYRVRKGNPMDHSFN
jgi:hypothetical protein